jgi:hypothetical protein
VENPDHHDRLLERAVEDQVIAEPRDDLPSDVGVARAGVENLPTDCGVCREKIGRVEDGSADPVSRQWVVRCNEGADCL